MSALFDVCVELLGRYRERGISPEFWAEPLNALTNASFLIAPVVALDLAIRRRAATRTTVALLSLAGVIGIGSFFFHTVPNQVTMWLDLIPIGLFQVVFLWLATHKMLAMNRWTSAGIVIGIVGSSFALFPVHQPLNGCLFYMPLLLAMLTIGIAWSRTSKTEPYLFVGAACCFALAVTARAVDLIVPWRFGTHFLWHVLSSVVVYLALRGWIVFVAAKQNLATRAPAVRGSHPR